MDISNLTSLITSFRAETRQDAITPDTLGQLLQKIVNLLAEAGDSASVDALTQWKDTVTAIGSVLTKLALGTDDRNNICLNIGSINTSTGATQTANFTIRQATTERAGAMTAQQVTDLNIVRNNMQRVAALQLKVSVTASTASLQLYDSTASLFNDASKLAVSLPVASSTQAGIVTAADYKRIGSSSHPFFHIACDSKDGSLTLKYNSELLELGYIPYLLRFSKKKPRYRDATTKGRRWYGPLMRGWHLFHDGNKIQVALNGTVKFGNNTGTGQSPVWEYAENIRYLFGNIRAVWQGTTLNRKLVGYRVGFGCRTHFIQTNHRFRFGIVFGPPLNATGNRSLNLAQCVTNIAEFYVNFNFTGIEDEQGNFYALAYSI